KVVMRVLLIACLPHGLDKCELGLKRQLHIFYNCQVASFSWKIIQMPGWLAYALLFFRLNVGESPFC
ncbi:hypothetical protein ACJX0J_020847, partial [Zea mays]